MAECWGPYRDEDDGSLYCAKDHTNAPDCGESWDDFCDKCRDAAQAYQELLGDCVRDDA
jgi:hypothetical protein